MSLDIWLELKHYLIGFQRNTRYEARAYFTDPTGGIKPDIDKLVVTNTVARYILILATANPGSIGWLEAVQDFNQKFLPLYLYSLTNPDDFPPTFFLGLLRVVKATEA